MSKCKHFLTDEFVLFTGKFFINVIFFTLKNFRLGNETIISENWVATLMNEINGIFFKIYFSSD